jgi:hypothetical protein
MCLSQPPALAPRSKPPCTRSSVIHALLKRTAGVDVALDAPAQTASEDREPVRGSAGEIAAAFRFFAGEGVTHLTACTSLESSQPVEKPGWVIKLLERRRSLI